MADNGWPADAVERRAVGELVPYARNARLHSDAQVAQIVASIREFGWTQPVLIAEDGTIVAGHGRVLAARELGLETVPVVVARGWSDERRRRYTLADNKIADNSTWDEDLLAVELRDLDLRARPAGDLAALGFSEGELAAVLDGWLPDMEKVDATEADADPLLALIKVKCPQVARAEVEALIRQALDGRDDVALS